MSRIFSIRINLDEMSSRLDALGSSDETMDWLRGFRIGTRGGQAKSGWSTAMACGHEFGLNAHLLAQRFSEIQAAKGRLRNMGDYNRSQPPPSQAPATAEPSSSHGSAISSNPVIQESNNPIIQGNGRAPATPPDIFDPDEDPIELAQPMPPESMVMNWRDWRSQHGSVFVARRGDDGDPEAWEATFKLYGPECFDGMYSALKPTAKRIYFNVALQWLEANTKDIA